MEIDFNDDSDKSDTEMEVGASGEDEMTAELRRREAEDEEIQKHLHQDDAEESANLNAIINEETTNGLSVTNGAANEDGTQTNGDGAGSEEDDEEDEEDEEDDIQITIGDFTKPSLAGAAGVNLNLKGGRQFGTAAGTAASKSKSSLDLDTVGNYKDEPIFDINLDTLEDKPWRKPGADITDYFNYGFNEDTWKVYCDRQKKIRSMNAANVFDINNVLNLATMPMKALSDGSMIMSAPMMDKGMSLSSVNENSKYNSSGSIVINTSKKPGPPPGRKTSGSIDVIGGSSGPTLLLTPMLQPRDPSTPPRDGPLMSMPNSMATTKENFITVIGQRQGPLPFPPPGMGMPPPPFFGHEFPPGLRPPMGILPPPIGPNGQPLPFVTPDNFPLGPPRFGPHGGGILPHPDSHNRPPFDDDFAHDRRPRLSPSRERHHERERHSSRDRDSLYGGSSSRRGGGGGSSYRDSYDDGGSSRSSRRDHYRESRDYRDSERSRERSRERSSERPPSDRQSDRSSEKPSERPTERPRDKDYESASSLTPLLPLPTPVSSSSSSSTSRKPRQEEEISSNRRSHRDRGDHKDSKDRSEKESKSDQKEYKDSKEKADQREPKDSKEKADHYRSKEKEKEKEKPKEVKSESKSSKSSKHDSKHDSHDERKHTSRHGDSKSSISSKSKKSSHRSSKEGKSRKED